MDSFSAGWFFLGCWVGMMVTLFLIHLYNIHMDSKREERTIDAYIKWMNTQEQKDVRAERQEVEDQYVRDWNSDNDGGAS